MTMATKCLPRQEVIKRLRQREEPIRMFGESDEDAYNRLMKLELSEQDTSSHPGLRNDFRDAMDKVNQEYMVVLNNSCSSSLEMAATKADVKTTDFNISLDEVTAQIQEFNTSPGFKPDETTTAQDCEIILKFLRFLLEMWGKRLNSRSPEIKTSNSGKNDSARYTQTQSYLKPLFKLLRAKKVSSDMLRLLKLIVKDLVAKNYQEAEKHYLELSIGNAPWPIGVTMVGIHARTGREKISQGNIAHALNDDTQRKFIQGLKRLMTQCQNMFP